MYFNVNLKLLTKLINSAFVGKRTTWTYSNFIASYMYQQLPSSTLLSLEIFHAFINLFLAHSITGIFESY